MSIHEKLMNIQRDLKCNKGQYNSFGKYRYRSCEDILESVKPLLTANNAILTISDTLEQVGDRYYIKATATLTDAENGESVTCSAYAREEAEKKGMDASQVTGACSSYARKYALNGLFCIDDTKDADATNTGEGDLESYAVCSACNQQIKPIRKRDGDTWHVNDIVSYSTRRFGKVLCPDCQKAAVKAGE